MHGSVPKPRACEPSTRSQDSGWSVGPLAVRWLLVALTFLLATFELADYDIWWHLRTGELIQERGAVPQKDWYSFQAVGQEWLDVHWGFQVLFSWIQTRFGVPGMVLAKATIAALAVAIALSAYRATWSPTVQILIWIPALLLMSSRFYVRPEILTLLFTSIYLSVLFHAEERPGWLWLLPLVQVLWANVQGLFSFGPILVAMYLVEAVLRSGRTRGLWRHLAPVSLLVPAACFLSPYGIRNVLFPFELWLKLKPGENIFRQNVAELQDFQTFWTQGGFVNPYAILFVVVGMLAAVTMLLAAWKILSERRAFWVLAAIGFTYLGLQAIRNGNHFALVVGTVATWCLGSMTESQHRPRVFGTILSGMLILGLGFAVVSGRWYAVASPDRRLGLENRSSFNSPAAMQLAGREGMPERAALFNFGQAGEYIYFNGPARQVLFDGRLEVYTEQQFRDFLSLENEIGGAGGNWDAQLLSQKCDLAIVDSEHNHVLQSGFWAHPAWKCIHYDEVVAVFLRRTHAAPAGVLEFSFAKALFDSDPNGRIGSLPGPGRPPTWTIWPADTAFKAQADFLAERAGHLGLGMISRTNISPAERLANAAFVLQHADRAVSRRPWSAEARRFRGIAGYLAAFAIDPGARVDSAVDSWSPDTGLLFAQSSAAFRQAIECNASDYSGNFYLYLYAKQSGFLDEAERMLEACTRITASNVARQKLQGDLAKDLAALRGQIAERGALPDAADMSFENLMRLAKRGLLGKSLEQFESSHTKSMTVEQIDRVGIWLMQLGRAERALDVYLTLQPTDPAALAHRSLRTGQCKLLLGNYSEARDDLNRGPAGYEQAFARAWLDLITGNAAGLNKVVAEAEQLSINPEQRRRLRLLATLALGQETKEPLRPAP